MHGLSFAASIVKTVEESVKKYSSAKVTEVEVELGKSSGIDAEELKYCFEIAAKETIAEGARLQVVEVPAKLRCQSCGNCWESEHSNAVQCTKCGSPSLELLSEGRVLVKNIKIEVK